MAFAPPKNSNGSKLQLKLSSWTPLNHQLMNDKVFEERRALLGKWFDKWTDGQRRRILLDLLERCSLSQQKFCAKQLQARVPTEAVDFTTRLPRVLSLYIFSFLDPRSLCRCAQVSWNWKQLSELDQLWMLKCLRFGWLLNFCPTPFEQGVWKKHYLEMVRELRLSRPKTPSMDEFIVIDVKPVKSNVPERKPLPGTARTPSKDEFIVIDVQPVKSNVPERKPPPGTARVRKELPPWRSSDRNPTDTVRYNFLDNQDPIEQARQARSRGGGHTPDLSREAAERRKKRGARGSRQLPKFSLSADLQALPKPPVRPSWAAPPQTGAVPAKALARSSRWNAGIRPGPVRAPGPRPRGAGDTAGVDTGTPSPPPFEAQPWQIPSSHQGSDTE